MELCRNVVGKCARRIDVGYLVLSIVDCAAEVGRKIKIPLYEGV
jgi:hypothetical protein